MVAGMARSMTMIARNDARAQSIMLFFMSIAFFGKGNGELGWTIISDTSPKGMSARMERFSTSSGTWPASRTADYDRTSDPEDWVVP
jgi:hypothetical protein